MEEVEALTGEWVVQEYRKRYILSDIAFKAICMPVNDAPEVQYREKDFEY